MRNPHIEFAAKVGALAFLWESDEREDGHGYTAIDLESYGRSFGASRQTAGRVAHNFVDVGAWSKVEEKEKCIVPDKRRGKREIEKTHFHFAPTTLFARPEDLRKPDGAKKQGGSLPRCKRCQGENTLKRIYHTMCTVCGYEDVFYDDEALMIKHEHEQQQADIAPTVNNQPPSPEPETIEAPQESDENLTAARALLTKITNHGCSLRIREDGDWGIGVPNEWTDERYTALERQIFALDSALRQIIVVQDEHESAPAPQANSALAKPRKVADLSKQRIVEVSA